MCIFYICDQCVVKLKDVLFVMRIMGSVYYVYDVYSHMMPLGVLSLWYVAFV